MPNCRAERVLPLSPNTVSLLCAMLASMPVLTAHASTAGAAEEIAVVNMSVQLLGGLALFLFGMEQMADALKAIAGERLRIVLEKLTTNRFVGAVTGAFVTAIIQSSSVTTVLVVGFITAGLMSMPQSIGIIMGANIGTTITAQIVAFNVTNAALPMIAAGFGMLFISEREKIRQYGAILLGLGMIFLGMGIMSDAMLPLRDYPPFLDLMVRMENPLIGILVAAAFTGLVQSSSATTGIVIVMASQGFITLPAGIALALGANIGTCITSILASLGKPVEAKRAAMVHVLFNVFGVALWFGFIPYLAEFVVWFSPAHPDLEGVDRLAAEAPRQIANAHSVFNIANTFIFIGFAGQLARLVEKLVPDQTVEAVAITQPRYLSEELIDTPSLALQQVRLELGHMGEHVQAMLQHILPAILTGDRLTLRSISAIDEKVDILHGHIVTYLGQISGRPLTEKEAGTLGKLMAAANELENIGDIVETDLAALGYKRIQERVAISKTTQGVLKNLHEVIMTAMNQALLALMLNDEQAARAVVSRKLEINRLLDSAAMHESRRLVATEPNRLAAYTIEMDIIDKMQRIYYLSKRIAKTVQSEAAGEEAVA